MRTNRPFQINIPISKIDEEQRIVTGVATTEALDSQGDIVDYEASKKAFSEWKGNIREMHGSTSVGKAIDIQFDDVNKQVLLSSYISESADGQNAWTKIKEGILTGYSIGGRMLEVVKDKSNNGANRIMNYQLSETSLVDNPACPEALFSMVKSVDGGLQQVETIVEPKSKLPDTWWMDKFMPNKEIKKSVYDASEAISLATQLSYLIMMEQNEPDQVTDLVTAFNALRDFIGKEVAEGDDFNWQTEYTEVIELATKAIDLKKGANMADKENINDEVPRLNNINKGGIAVVDSDARDEQGNTVAEVTPVAPVKAGTIVPKKVYGKNGATTNKSADSANEEEEVVDEAVAEDTAKSSEIANLAKNVETLLAKLGDSQEGVDLKKVTDNFQKLSDKVEKSITSLEGRIKALEDSPLPAKAKATYSVITKGEGSEVIDAHKQALLKRQAEITADPFSAEPGEAEAIFQGLRKAAAAESQLAK